MSGPRTKHPIKALDSLGGLYIMFDTHVRPVYDDSLFTARLCLGEKMDVQGVELSPEIIRGHLRDLTETGVVYRRSHLVEMVTEHHEELGGVPSDAEVNLQVKKALASLMAQGLAENPRHGSWRLNFDALPTEHEQEIKAQAGAEVSVGHGEEAVYGWYLPQYRESAEDKGKAIFAMKVGRTIHRPQERANASANHAPERYRMGFLLKSDDSSSWEKLIHACLDLRGRRRHEAAGDEWFNTSPDELKNLWQALHAAIHGDDQ